MPHARFTGEEIERSGEGLYKEKLRATVETEENIGKIICIDIETGSYEIDADHLTAGKRVHALHPGAAVYAKRIGYNAVTAIGGSLVRTTP